MIATREDLRKTLTRYEGAVQRAIDEIGDDAADAELTEARNALMDILQQAKAAIEARSQFSHDHESLEEFVRALARATEYKSHPLGFEDSIDSYWKIAAEDWVQELDAARTAPQVQTEGPKCKQCGAFTTYTRVNTHGLCMKCEQEQSI